MAQQLKVFENFEALGLREDLLRGIYAYGFERPSAIQQRAIEPIVAGRDIIAQSQSGTGKTAVFCIGMLQVLNSATNETQMLALSPTRELAEQTQKVCLALGDYMNVQCHTCIGGKSIGEDIRRLDYGVQIVSGTPGRVFDMIQRRSLQTRNLKMLVIDEADEMLNRGFKDQIYDIYRYLPPSIQVVLVSATMPQEVLDMTKKFMNEPVHVLVKRDELTLEGIKQFFVAVERARVPRRAVEAVAPDRARRRREQREIVVLLALLEIGAHLVRHALAAERGGGGGRAGVRGEGARVEGGGGSAPSRGGGAREGGVREAGGGGGEVRREGGGRPADVLLKSEDLCRRAETGRGRNPSRNPPRPSYPVAALAARLVSPWAYLSRHHSGT